MPEELNYMIMIEQTGAGITASCKILRTSAILKSAIAPRGNYE